MRSKGLVCKQRVNSPHDSLCSYPLFVRVGVIPDVDRHDAEITQNHSRYKN